MTDIAALRQQFETYQRELREMADDLDAVISALSGVMPAKSTPAWKPTPEALKQVHAEVKARGAATRDHLAEVFTSMEEFQLQIVLGELRRRKLIEALGRGRGVAYRAAREPEVEPALTRMVDRVSSQRVQGHESGEASGQA